MKFAIRALAWLLLAFLTAMTVVPAPDRPVTGLDHNFEHLVAFVSLGALFSVGYPDKLRQLMLGGIGFTLLLEMSQVPLATRHARVSDFLVDTLAVWLGLFVGHLFRRLSQRIRAS